jgi:hypothetical protein
MTVQCPEKMLHGMFIIQEKLSLKVPRSNGVLRSLASEFLDSQYPGAPSGLWGPKGFGLIGYRFYI